MSTQPTLHIRIKLPCWVKLTIILWAAVYAALINSRLIKDNPSDPVIQHVAHWMMKHARVITQLEHDA